MDDGMDASAPLPGAIALCGATATGKSGLALALARQLNTAILSLDSRQVYRELNIGTAKPTPAERAAVPHYLIDICDPREQLTLAQYQDRARAVLAQFARLPPPDPSRPKGELPLLVGGTGLYFQAIARGLKIPRVPPQPALRSQLQHLGQPQCHALLARADPDAAAKIHPNDRVRTRRALEVLYTTGVPISQQQGEAPPAYPILALGLDAPPEALARRIERRTRQMLAAGLAEEVAALGERYGWDLPLLETLGYREMRAHLRGELGLGAARDAIVLRTRQFAKRQRTWFQAYPEIEWFHADAPDLLDRLEARIRQFRAAIAPSQLPARP